MMVVLQVISTTCGNDVEVVMSPWPTLARCDAGTVKLIVGIIHLINTEYCFQTTLIKSFVMSHQWQSLDGTIIIDMPRNLLLRSAKAERFAKSTSFAIDNVFNDHSALAERRNKGLPVSSLNYS